MTGRPFRQDGEPGEGSAVLGKLDWLWELAEHRRGHITQKMLADRAKVSTSTLNDWVKGRSRKPDLDQLTRVGEVLANWAGVRPLTSGVWSELIAIDAGRASRPATAVPSEDQSIRLIGEVDPTQLEIHRAIAPLEEPAEPLPYLTPYVPRLHDQELAAVVKRAVAGNSEIAVLVGASSTGKTRACWEAARSLPSDWRLWHPIDPSWQEALLAGLPSVGPRTVIWLNEIQRYLNPPELGERVAAGLRILLGDEHRRPVLLLGTTWSGFWRPLIEVPSEPADRDRQPQARALLAGKDIQVPGTFSRAEFSKVRLAAQADPRWAMAVEGAQDAEFIQYLAAAPHLLNRYQNVGAAARALLTAAMDARRLGLGQGLPLPMLTDAIPGYLTERENRLLQGADGWLGKALGDVREPLWEGTIPLGPVLLRPGQPPPRHEHYQLADYLEQTGRNTRATEEAPAEFWVAACRYADDEDVLSLARVADSRGLFSYAARLYKRAALSGDNDAARQLLARISSVDAAHLEDAASWIAAHATPRNGYAFYDLLKALHAAGAEAGVCQLAARAVDETDASVKDLLNALTKAGATAAIATVGERVAAARPAAQYEDLPRLILALQQAGATGTAALVAGRLPASTDLDLTELKELRQLSEAGLADVAAGALNHLVDSADVTDPKTAQETLWRLRSAGYPDAAARLAERVAVEADLSHPGLVGYLIKELRRHGTESLLLRRDPVAGAVFERAGNPMAAVARLVVELGNAGASELARQLIERVPAAESASLLDNLVDRASHAEDQVRTAELVTVAADKAIAHAPMGSSEDARALLGVLRRARAEDAIRMAVAKIEPGIDVRDPRLTGLLIDTLHRVGADEAAAMVASAAVARTDAQDAPGVSTLITEMADAGLPGPALELAARAAGPDGASLDAPEALPGLLDAMRVASADDAFSVLAARICADIHRADENLSAETFARLLDRFHDAAMPGVVTSLLRQVLARLEGNDAGPVSFLIEQSHRLGELDLLAEIEAVALPAVDLADASDATDLLGALRQAKSAKFAEVAIRAAATATLDHGPRTAAFLRELCLSDAREAALVLAGRITRNGDPGLLNYDPLVADLRQLGADEAVSVLVDRAIGNVSPDDLEGHLRLLDVLDRAGSPEQQRELVARGLSQAVASARVVAHRPDGYSDVEMTAMSVSRTVKALRRVEASEAVTVFVDRAAAQGAFAEVLEVLPGWAKRYRYGRSPGGAPAPAWGWQDLA